MSAPILNSNSNSALISTLSSSDALINPYEYSLEKMLPFGAKYTTEVQPVQGSGQSFGSNSVIDFDLPKWGMLGDVCMSFGITNVGSSALSPNNFSAIGALACIENIELLSSSRRILNLSYKDILCMYSDYPNSQRQCIESFHRQYANGMTTTKYEEHNSPHYSLQIPFSLFFNHKLNPNLLFQEPLRVRIHLSDMKISGTGGDGTTAFARFEHKVYNPNLTCEYFNPPRELEDKTIEENYSDGSLSVVCYDWSDENEVVGKSITTASTYGVNDYLECEIKDVGVVSDIYFMVSLDHGNVVEGSNGDQTISKENSIIHALAKRHRGAEPIVRCELTANGQTIFAKTFEELRVFGRKSDGKDPYTLGNSSTTVGEVDNVFKIPLCLSDDKRYPCGGISLRELHNVRLRVWVKGEFGEVGAANNLPAAALPTDTTAAGTEVLNVVKPVLKVMLKKYQILTTESASGRVITSVAN